MGADTIAPGTCGCGCGGRTSIIVHNRAALRLVAGTRRRFLKGHQLRMGA